METTSLRVLMLEDEPLDAELASRELRRAGWQIETLRVETRPAFEQALIEFRPDLILADFRLPSFDGLSALALANQKRPEVPFIFLSGAMGEALAIEMLHRGAADYVLKEQLAKLAPAVRRALDEAEMRRERQRFDAALRRSNRFLRTLLRCNEALVRATSERELLDGVCRNVVEIGGFAAAWVLSDAPRPKLLAWYGPTLGEQGENLNALLAACADHSEAILCTVLQEKQPEVLDNITAAVLTESCRQKALALGFRSVVCLPMLRQRDFYGWFVITASEPGVFGPEEVALLDELAGDMAFGLATLRLRREEEEGRRRLEKALEETIMAIAGTIEARDPYTAGHQRQVARLAEAIAQRMGLETQRIAGVVRGAMMHDIGKIAVPAEILNRPGQLSPIEFDLIRSHPRTGYEIVKDIAFPWPLAQMILQHHERLDGSGYPQRLKSEAILLEARILAVADVADAMRSHRPYRIAQSLEQTMDELRAGAGRLYDPVVVEACIAVLQEKSLPQWHDEKSCKENAAS